MSAPLLKDRNKESMIQDDLESFFYVIVYTAMRYLKYNFSPATVAVFMHRYFDKVYRTKGGDAGGQFKRSIVRLG